MPLITFAETRKVPSGRTFRSRSCTCWVVFQIISRTWHGSKRLLSTITAIVTCHYRFLNLLFCMVVNSAWLNAITNCTKQRLTGTSLLPVRRSLRVSKLHKCQSIMFSGCSCTRVCGKFVYRGAGNKHSILQLNQGTVHLCGKCMPQEQGVIFFGNQHVRPWHWQSQLWHWLDVSRRL